MPGEVKSLMEQLRGEALKFHKPGKKKPPEHFDSVGSLLISTLLLKHYFLRMFLICPRFCSCRREL